VDFRRTPSHRPGSTLFEGIIVVVAAIALILGIWVYLGMPMP
jgi:hypothetical protein